MPHFAFKYTAKLLETPTEKTINAPILAARSETDQILIQAPDGKSRVSSPDLSLPKGPLMSPNMSFIA